MIALLALALWVLPDREPEGPRLLTLSTVESDDMPEELDALLEPEPLEASLDAPEVLEPEPARVEIAPPNPTSATSIEPPPVPTSDVGELTAAKNLLQETGVGDGGLSGRGSRGALVGRNGGTPQSEAAVARALKWLAAHQNSDGSWSLDHRRGRCEGRCGDPGHQVSDNGATALALLPFLGAGHTHKKGPYQKTVAEGLKYLAQATRRGGHRGSLADGGTMYAHGLAAIALCEAYAMTRDRELREPAQAALDYIVYAQDPTGGGWRYRPRQAGDTSVVGWQIMALKSGHMAYLEVPASTFKKAERFLDRVQTDYGAAYGYTGPAAKPSTSAVGLLCRMYLGWKREREALARGARRLAQIGPSRSDLYYDYYATQTLFQFTMGRGPLWDQWNTEMREQLIATQARGGHQDGSWYSDGPHAGAGGRLYCTAMSAMILEVYYRHMPIYQHAAVDAAFP
jgi:hypothetical protein